MADILVRLYDLAPIEGAMKKANDNGIIIRRPIGPEKNAICQWITDNFNSTWACESETALFNSPKTMYVAIKEAETPEIVGFACWDATVKGFFGPTGVSKSCRGMGVGNALLQACLHAMREEGYGYAIIGSAGKSAIGFYEKALPKSSITLEGSSPGVYKNMVIK